MGIWILVVKKRICMHPVLSYKLLETKVYNPGN